MKFFFFRPLVLPLLLVALAGCGRKKEEPVAEANEPSTEVAIAPAGTAEKAPRGEPVESRGGSPVAPVPAAGLPADPADGVPAGLLASDKAYEAWFKKYQLDLNDPKMLDADPDGDGATNRDEFMADTNPRDAKSRPGIHTTLRLKEYKEIQVPLILESITGHTARIKRMDDGASDLVDVGGTIGGLKVEKIASRHETDKNGQPVDLSRVELSDPVSKGKVVLIKDMAAKSAQSYAVLTAADGTVLKVRQGDVFQWPAQTGVRYLVIDLRSEQVVIQEIENNRMWTIQAQ